MFAMTVLPCALMLVSYFLYKKKYKLDEEEYDRICAELAKKQGKGEVIYGEKGAMDHL